MAPITGTFSLISPQDLAPALDTTPLGDASVNLKLASGSVKTPAHLSTPLPVDFTFHAGAAFTATALNGQNGVDDAGVLAAKDAVTPAGQFTPPLRFDKTHGWLKYAADADVKVDVTASSPFVKFVGHAGKQLTMSDYHRHRLDEAVPALLAVDLLSLRSPMVLNHVQNLPEGDALAFQTRGELTTALEIEWGDVFTSEIGGLARLLKSAAPIAIRATVGATCTVNVAVVDSFTVVFARRDGGKLVVAVRKSDQQKVDANAGVTVEAEIADPKMLEVVLDDVVAGLLDLSVDRLKALLKSIAGRALTADDTLIIAAIADRLKLPTVADIAKAIEDLKTKARDKIAEIVKSKATVSFTYEYHRVSSDVSVFEAEIPAGGPNEPLHQQLVGGDLAGAFGQKRSQIAVKRFLNESSTVVSKAWGFTLGLNKWRAFGQDRRKLEAVDRTDRVAGTVSRSYLGSGGYARNKLSWSVDFAADMESASLNPLVREFVFGLHIAMIRDEQTFDADDLETAVDFAALWSMCPESSLAFVRKQLSPSVGKKAEWSYQLRVNDEALRAIVRVLGSMAPQNFSGAAAAALDATILPSLAQRRMTYQGLWHHVLVSAEAFNVGTIRAVAESLLPPNLAARERTMLDTGMFDQSTVASIVAFDSDWFNDCARFVRGCRQLADAIETPTRDTGKIPDIYNKLVGFWTQSHYVRTLGCALVDVARSMGQLRGVERTLTFTSEGSTVVISSNQP